MVREKRKLFFQLILAAFPLLIPIVTVIVVDPYFHYHKPIKGLENLGGESRWLNDGLIRHFDYETMLSGTSLDENLDFNYFEELFETSAIKTTYPGAKIPELAYGIRKACEENDNLRNVFMSISCGNQVNYEYDDWTHEGLEFPDFLYDDNVLNDWPYLLNFKTFARCFKNIRAAVTHTNLGFDAWGRREDESYGKEVVLNEYRRLETIRDSKIVSETDRQRIRKNININLVSVAQEYPNVTFYYYIPPKAITWWDNMYRNGALNLLYEEIEIVFEELLQCDNIKVFYFLNETEIAEELDNFKDSVHYGSWVNDMMMEKMKEGENLVTSENYLKMLQDTMDYYNSYDYDAFFE